MPSVVTGAQNDTTLTQTLCKPTTSQMINASGLPVFKFDYQVIVADDATPTHKLHHNFHIL